MTDFNIKVYLGLTKDPDQEATPDIIFGGAVSM